MAGMPSRFARTTPYQMSAMASSHPRKPCAPFPPRSRRFPTFPCIQPASTRNDAARPHTGPSSRLTSRDRGPRSSAPASSPAALRFRSPAAACPGTCPSPPRSRLRCPGPVLAERFERRDALARQRHELFLEPRLVVGHVLGAVACAADLHVEHLLVGEVRVVGFDRGDHVVDGAALERVHGRGPGPVGVAKLRIAGIDIEGAPFLEPEGARPSFTAVTSAV